MREAAHDRHASPLKCVQIVKHQRRPRAGRAFDRHTAQQTDLAPRERFRTQQCVVQRPQTRPDREHNRESQLRDQVKHGVATVDRHEQSTRPFDEDAIRELGDIAESAHHAGESDSYSGQFSGPVRRTGGGQDIRLQARYPLGGRMPIGRTRDQREVADRLTPPATWGWHTRLNGFGGHPVGSCEARGGQHNRCQSGFTHPRICPADEESAHMHNGDTLGIVRAMSDTVRHVPPPARAPGRALALVQIGLLAALVLTTPLRRPGWLALVLVGSGVALGVWAIGAMGWRKVSVWPEPPKDASPVHRGPYAVIRHPMYSAALLAAAGLAWHGGGWVRWVAWAVLAAVLAAKARIEERLLTQRFPDYGAYAARTWRWIPYLW